MSLVIPIPNSKNGHCAPFHFTKPADCIESTQGINKSILLPEWAKTSFVQLTWPHENTDWAYMLQDVYNCYLQLTYALAQCTKVLIVTPNPEEISDFLKERLPNTLLENIQLFQCPTNDTWARDHAFLTCCKTTEGCKKMQYLDFKFNGWGGKFEANLDNQINKTLYDNNVLHGDYIDHLDFELEGGSIETDGEGTLLTTSTCLLNPNRNPQFSKEDIENKLKDWFGINQVLWLEHGFLAGDDTDSHIDTLARLCPNNTIAYVKCSDENDMHYEALKAMENELMAFKTLSSAPYRLVALPMATPAYDEDGERLPATYANYLVVNNTVLMPTYNDPETDLAAKEALASAFPGYEIIGVDCRALIRQHGSLHCATMQYPCI